MIENQNLNATHTYGYLRVSTTKQELDVNRNDILLFANNNHLGHVTFFEETVSGRKDWRKRKLGELFDIMQSGDKLIMSEVSRISRNMFDSIEFIALCKRKGIQIFSLINDIPSECDAMANLIICLNSWKSECERKAISWRTKQSLKLKKEQGIILGRPKGSSKLEGKNNDKVDLNKKLISDMINKGIKLKFIAKELNVTDITLRKFIYKYELKKKF